MNELGKIIAANIEDSFRHYVKDDYLNGEELYLNLVKIVEKLKGWNKILIVDTVMGLAEKAGCPRKIFELRLMEARRKRMKTLAAEAEGFSGIEAFLDLSAWKIRHQYHQ